VVLGLRGRRRARRRARDAKGTSKRRVKTSDVRCARHVATASCQVRSMRTFFTHPSVSIFDRVPFQRTDEHLSKITRSASTAVAPKISRPDRDLKKRFQHSDSPLAPDTLQLLKRARLPPPRRRRSGRARPGTRTPRP
jgi:hypothetical protein